MVIIKILTSVKIPQCPVWTKKTDLLFENTRKKVTLISLWRILKLYWKCDVVVTSGTRYAQIFGIYRSFLGGKKPKHIILELMLDEERSDIIWKIKVFFQRVSFSSVDVVFVSARREINVYAKRLKLPTDRIRFLPFHTNIIEPRMVPASGGYIFSAGKSGRDFATLAAAVEGLDIKVVVVTDQCHLHEISLPPNVEVQSDIPYEKYLELLNGCSMVVVPLKKLVRSTGQVVILEAMALGKPVVTTDTVGTEDYIQHGVTGWLVPPEDSNALRAAVIKYIEYPESFQIIAVQALKQIKEKHTFNVYTHKILNAANEIATLS
jgi:glycosyltransferase involved in cell wall biosynthesis